MGKTYSLHSSAFLSVSLKTFHSSSTLKGFTKNVAVGNLKLLFRTLVFKVRLVGPQSTGKNLITSWNKVSYNKQLH